MPPSEFIEMHWTSATLDEAKKVAQYLVQSHLVACAQIIPSIESIYIWNDSLETAHESKVVLKTLRQHSDAIIEIICQMSSYQVPEVLIFTIVDGHQGYLEWLRKSLTSPL